MLASLLLCGQAGKGGAGSREEFGPDRGMRGLLIAWDFHGESDFNENIEVCLVIDLATVPMEVVFVLLCWESRVKVGIFPSFYHFHRLSLYCCSFILC